MKPEIIDLAVHGAGLALCAMVTVGAGWGCVHYHEPALLLTALVGGAGLLAIAMSALSRYLP